ncbi:enoyl-CoA hydratase-related protein [Aeromonas schubertii]|uniref:enoyl-CoA hydratase-related protein n=2 Tax=Aeromonas schubertii TaxID=652 RepID=UPI0010A7C658|nr:enoyl-CoA hydratase-related protein [Aeromonas schubertii]MBZ6070790.1 enoyl-CoA hydratase/isomerase family protein [Aeromonas schubertii]QCG47202.1 enoyl-CoA hydratase [Aeromonas schubertii]
MEQVIKRHCQEGVLTLTLTRPEKRNALNTRMYQELTLSLQGAKEDEAIRVVLLQGDEHCFTAGNDLADFLGKESLGEDDPILTFLHTLADFPKPVVVAAAGPAVGIGTTLLLHCDLVCLADNARLCLPFVDLGLVPEFASSLLLPRAVGHLRASELLLLGAPFGAAEAQAMGLANRVVPATELLATARALATALAAKPPRALQQSKALLKQELRQAVHFTIDMEARAFALALQGEEAQQRIASRLARSSQ